MAAVGSGAKQILQALESISEPSAVPTVETGPRAFATDLVLIVDGIGRALRGNFRGRKEVFLVIDGTAKMETARFLLYLPHG
jgi:hypothetical protein